MSDWTHVEGLSELDNKFNEVLKKMDKINGQALQDVALDLLGKSKDLAPIDLGDLRGSASVQFENNTATIGFVEPYAVSQHEHVEYKHPQGGEAKYLEKPFRENINKYINHIADANREALK